MHVMFPIAAVADITINYANCCYVSHMTYLKYIRHDLKTGLLRKLTQCSGSAGSSAVAMMPAAHSMHMSLCWSTNGF